MSHPPKKYGSLRSWVTRLTVTCEKAICASMSRPLPQKQHDLLTLRVGPDDCEWLIHLIYSFAHQPHSLEAKWELSQNQKPELLLFRAVPRRTAWDSDIQFGLVLPISDRRHWPLPFTCRIQFSKMTHFCNVPMITRTQNIRWKQEMIRVVGATQ